jgi:phosphoglycolate phosphatase
MTSPVMRSARAVIFDLDGTLVDSLADIITHLNAAMGDHGLPARTPIEIGEWVGYGAEQLVQRAVPDASQVAAVLATFRARYRANPVIDTKVFPELPAFLDALARSHVLAVLSNKPHELTVAVVERVLAQWPFKVVHGQRADRPRKPDPAALVRVCSELDIAPSDCVLVGDSEVDIQTARNAGIRGICVTWGLRDPFALRAAQPDVMVETVAELAALFALPLALE